MAESSSSNNTHGCPISRIAPDQLYSILLLLPVNSIISFSMTCKRFNSILISDSLWEAIYRRDWGPNTVDALKSSSKFSNLPWLKLYQKFSAMDSLSCCRLSQHEDDFGLLPRPRASHSLNFVSDSLVLFGGGCEGGRHLDDTWVAYVGSGVGRIINWQRVQSETPSGRFGHTCVIVGNDLVLFGGINDKGVRQNDTWVGHVTYHDNLGITFSWKLLDVGSTAPPPRGAHAGCCIDDRKMIIHGGIGFNGLRLGDTWVLDLSENLHFGTWREIVTQPSPPARSGHTLTCIGGTKTVLFGGRGAGYDVLNDIWLCYTNEEEDVTWVQIQYDLQNIPDGVSLPRVGHSASLILGGRLLIYGGEDSYRHRKDDFWVLDTRAISSVEMQALSWNLKKLSVNMWKRLSTTGYKPAARSFHRACVDYSGCCLFVFGGMVDGLLQPAEVYGLRFDDELFLVELML
ncbi:hypothetical protein RJ641_020312 [Dillenia turbinata]|uniref:F-box domain-containing protein n=1 Tax=Dillenia turbinata TaxID=194707 RepID=A0AAN8YWS6_9MAGN